MEANSKGVERVREGWFLVGRWRFGGVERERGGGK